MSPTSSLFSCHFSLQCYISPFASISSFCIFLSLPSFNISILLYFSSFHSLFNHFFQFSPPLFVSVSCCLHLLLSFLLFLFLSPHLIFSFIPLSLYFILQFISTSCLYSSIQLHRNTLHTSRGSRSLTPPPSLCLYIITPSSPLLLLFILPSAQTLPPPSPLPPSLPPSSTASFYGGASHLQRSLSSLDDGFCLRSFVSQSFVPRGGRGGEGRRRCSLWQLHLHGAGGGGNPRLGFTMIAVSFKCRCQILRRVNKGRET